MKTKLVALAAVATAFTMGVSGCGSSSSSSDSKGDGTIASQMIFGGPPEFKTRPDGIPGLKKNYDVSFGKYTVTDVGGPVTVNALKRGQVDAADLFTTDPSIARDKLVELVDDRDLQPSENVIPLVRTEVVDRFGPELVKLVDKVSAQLTTAVLSDLNAQVEGGSTVAAVATSWLNSKGLQ